MNRKQSGRSSRKRFAQQQVGSFVKYMERLSASTDPADKQILAQLSATNKQVIAQKRELLLRNYRLELKRRSERLDLDGCWEFYYQTLPEARRWGLEAELRRATALYAAKFATSCAGNLPVVYEQV